MSFERALPPRRVANIVKRFGLEVDYLMHSWPQAGAYFPGARSIRDEMRLYARMFSSRHPGWAAPRITGARFIGKLSQRSLTALGVWKVRSIPSTSNASVLPSGRVVTGSLDPSSTDQRATLSIGKSKAWAPDYGAIEGSDLPGDLRAIDSSLVWENQSDIAAFGENAYEHDLKLHNPNNAASVRPFCVPFQDDDFWATRTGWMTETTFPSDTEPYWDITDGDSCQEMDLTAGIFEAANLIPGEYHISITTTGADHIDESVFSLRAESLPVDCPEFAKQPDCVDLLQRAERQVLINQNEGRRLPGVHEWASDSGNRPCGAKRSIQRLSLSSAGVEGNAASGSTWESSTSQDGRYTAFGSEATNLVAGDNNDRADIFVRDWVSEVTERVSVDSSGGELPAGGWKPSISADGRYVAFGSRSHNGASPDQVYVRDRLLDSTELVSVRPDGSPSNDFSGGALAISGNGRYVVFVSWSSDLVAGDTNGEQDVFLRDLIDETTTRITKGVIPGTESDGYTYLQVAISSTGAYAAFDSDSSNLVLDDNNSQIDTFVWDSHSDTISMASLSSSGAQGDSYSFLEDLSATGRDVVMWSEATNLVAGDTNAGPDVFVHRLDTGETVRGSLGHQGQQGNLGAYEASISAAGNRLAFSSDSSNLVPEDLNGSSDVFVRDLTSGTTSRVSTNGADTEANGFSRMVQVSDDGGRVLFASTACNLVPADGNQTWDLFSKMVTQ